MATIEQLSRLMAAAAVGEAWACRAYHRHRTSCFAAEVTSNVVDCEVFYGTSCVAIELYIAHLILNALLNCIRHLAPEFLRFLYTHARAFMQAPKHVQRQLKQALRIVQANCQLLQCSSSSMEISHTPVLQLQRNGHGFSRRRRELHTHIPQPCSG
jgi:hypothetical protein